MTAHLREDSSSSYSGEHSWGPPGPPLEPGEYLAPGYSVVEHLRRGHRLDVYDLWSEERSCRCVGKTLRPERADDESAAGWLRNEGLLLTTLTHPHLLRGYGTVLTGEPARPAGDPRVRLTAGAAMTALRVGESRCRPPNRLRRPPPDKAFEQLRYSLRAL